ncbi:hypothetical protein PGK05_04250 [Acinetobacter baumannii]|nr:hypothetical protein [Acinetobacter baumannii]
MSETIRIAELANLITQEIGDFLKWKIHPENDLDFPCIMKPQHFEGATETSNKTHPTDLVIYYDDPYENKRVFLNTDLKSYASDSIGYKTVKEWLISITKGTVCSLASTEWKQRYGIEGSFDIRGLLFVYNHDGRFDKPFYSFIHDYPNPPHVGPGKPPLRFYLKDLNVPANVKIHIIEPLLIDSILSIKHDLNILRTEQKVPLSDAFAPISFFYPNRQRFKSRITPQECPATIELISGPFFIMNYDNYTDFQPNPSDPKNPLIIQKSRGNIIYYKESGSTVDEFIYLIETLMMYELISENCETRIRHCARDKSNTAAQNFHAAIEKYCVMWDYSESMKTIFNKIEFNEVTIIQKIFCNQKIDRSPVQE